MDRLRYFTVKNTKVLIDTNEFANVIISGISLIKDEYTKCVNILNHTHDIFVKLIFSLVRALYIIYT
jgi:hypothetical protein